MYVITVKSKLQEQRIGVLHKSYEICSIFVLNLVVYGRNYEKIQFNPIVRTSISNRKLNISTQDTLYYGLEGKCFPVDFSHSCSHKNPICFGTGNIKCCHSIPSFIANICPGTKAAFVQTVIFILYFQSCFTYHRKKEKEHKVHLHQEF